MIGPVQWHVDVVLEFFFLPKLQGATAVMTPSFKVTPDCFELDIKVQPLLGEQPTIFPQLAHVHCSLESGQG